MKIPPEPELEAQLKAIHTNTELLLKISEALIDERRSSIEYSRPLMTNTKLLEQDVLDGRGKNDPKSDGKSSGTSNRDKRGTER